MRLAVFLGLVALATARVSYEGYQVFRTQVAPEQAAYVHGVVERLGLDRWGVGRDWIDVMVSPINSRIFKEHLARHGIRATVQIDDVQQLIERDYAAQEAREGVTTADFDFSVYHNLQDIEAYLSGLPEQDDRTSLNSLGLSVEGRDIWKLTISVGEGKQPIWFDCGLHAREWITTATCLWGINYLLTGYGVDADVTALLDAYDVLIIPVNNPDGYVYTQTDRMWRKNRAIYPEELCVGVDLNRNFDNNFGGPGSSNQPCENTYHGPSPASEPETQATQAGIDELASTAAALYSIHSYSQLWLYAYGYTTDLPPEADYLDSISKIGVDALTAVYGTPYGYGSIGTTIYVASGTTVDYAYAAGIVDSYTLELRDLGTYGFLLPESEIDPTSEETWAGLVAATLAL